MRDVNYEQRGTSMEQFKDLGLSDGMLKTLQSKGFEEPTPIQSAVIPYLLKEDRDIVAQAETGTGKTAAFGIPIIERLDERARGGVKAIVLVPTRELAIQVAGEIDSLRGARKLEILPVYGGQGFAHQLRCLKKKVDIVVGTPGRVLDHLGRGTLNMDDLRFFVLDEADEMFDMGFIEDIRAILAYAPAERRTLLFSATMPESVITIARCYMKKGYESIAMGCAARPQHLTDQKYIEVHEQDKFEVLCRIIDMEPGFYGLVFCRTRDDTADIAGKLIERGYMASGIHGDIGQFEREKIMRSFREKKITILVATDVAARGIDINNLSHVINYDVPQDSDAYVHRIGRTGRAGNRGTAITFVTSREHRMLDIIRRRTKGTMDRMHIPGVDEVIAAKRAGIRAQIEEVITEGTYGNYRTLAYELLGTGDASAVVAACLSRAYAGQLDPASYGKIRQVASMNAGACTQLFVARGRRHGITPPKLVKLVRQHCQIQKSMVKDIRIFDEFSYVSVPRAQAETVLQQFRNKRGRPMVCRAKVSAARSDTGRGSHPAGDRNRKGNKRAAQRHDLKEKRRFAAG